MGNKENYKKHSRRKSAVARRRKAKCHSTDSLTFEQPEPTEECNWKNNDKNVLEKSIDEETLDCREGTVFFDEAANSKDDQVSAVTQESSKNLGESSILNILIHSEPSITGEWHDPSDRPCFSTSFVSVNTTSNFSEQVMYEQEVLPTFSQNVTKGFHDNPNKTLVIEECEAFTPSSMGENSFVPMNQSPIRQTSSIRSEPLITGELHDPSDRPCFSTSSHELNQCNELLSEECFENKCTITNNYLQKKKYEKCTFYPSSSDDDFCNEIDFAETQTDIMSTEHDYDYECMKNINLASTEDDDQSDHEAGSSSLPNTVIFEDNLSVNDSHSSDEITRTSLNNIEHSFSDSELTTDSLHGVETDGYQIVDIFYMFNELCQKFNSHNNACPRRFIDFRLIKIKKLGLQNQIIFGCNNCNYTGKILTTPNKPKVGLQINKAAVAGSLTAGIGYSTLEEVFAAINVQCMSEPVYRKHRENLTDTIDEMVEEEMKIAAAEDKRLAIERGDVTLQGTPYITVSVDGAWSKRSYKSGKYDALSGVASIISTHTHKVLYCATRNKKCTVCESAARNQRHAKLHRCYKNWRRNDSSTAMEADIISRGFDESIEKLGLIYSTVVNDGDSSVHNAILERDPYKKFNIRTKRIRCKNHIMRNFCNSINAISLMLRNTRIPAGVTKNRLKQIIKASALKMRKHVETAMTNRKNESGTNEEKVGHLMDDINNMTGHFYGDHSRCAFGNEYCKTDEYNYVPILKKIRTIKGMIYDEISNAVTYHLVNNATSLLENFTTNDNESFNGIVTKTVGGKRTNQCNRNSYDLRVKVAAIQYNSQNALSKIMEYSGTRVQSVVMELENFRQKKVSYVRVYRHEHGRTKHTSHEADQYYGLAREKPDMTKAVLEKRMEQKIQELQDIQKNREQIQVDTMNQSDSELWHSLRRNMITASRFGVICRMKPGTSRIGLIKDILCPKNLDNNIHIRFGREHESRAIAQLSKTINKNIVRCGIFIDNEIPYLGASPDGLIDDDGIVEIKCFSAGRDKSPEDAIQCSDEYKKIFTNDLSEMNVNHKYFYQVQGQLHISDRNYCIFAVYTLIGMMHVRVERNNAFWKIKMLPFLTQFFMEALLPEIVDSRRERRLPIREAESVLIFLKNRAEGNQSESINQKRKKNTTSKTIPKRRKHNKNFDELELEIEKGYNKEVIHSNNHQASSWVVQSGVNNQQFDKDHDAVAEVLSRSIDEQEVINNIMTPNSYLGDSSIQLFLNIIKENTHFRRSRIIDFLHQHLLRPLTTKDDLTIIGGNVTRHYICLHYDGTEVHIYDSGQRVDYSQLCDEEKTYIAKCYPLVECENVIFEPVTRQPDGCSCGVYAAAFAATIALGNNPRNVEYSLDTGKMREKLADIIRCQQLTEFPTQGEASFE